MTNEQAALKLSLHIFQCGMLMPIKWLEANGKDSDMAEAFRLALAALRAQDTPNPPLTLEELQGVNGEPVWCKNFEMWALIYCHKDWDPILMLANGSQIFNRPARHYTLYRRKPEEE